MKRLSRMNLLFLFSAAFGCSAIVDDYEVVACPDTVTTCDDIAPDDPEMQDFGCCTKDKKVVFCKSGNVHQMACEACDYDPDLDKMACIGSK